jgi:hypothetical protein
MLYTITFYNASPVVLYFASPADAIAHAARLAHYYDISAVVNEVGTIEIFDFEMALPTGLAKAAGSD